VSVHPVLAMRLPRGNYIRRSRRNRGGAAHQHGFICRWDEVANLQATARHLKAIGQGSLPANQMLKVVVQDVDLAGTVRTNFRSWPSREIHHTGCASLKQTLIA